MAEIKHVSCIVWCLDELIVKSTKLKGHTVVFQRLNQMFSFIPKILCFETMIIWPEIITSERPGFERLTSSVFSLDFCSKSSTKTYTLYENIRLI